jgi:CheY-like chemotaxis protein
MSDDGAQTMGSSLHDVYGRGTDILVVDDTPSNLAAIEAALGDLGRRVVCASSGPEALQLLVERDFALILLDVQMPGMNGFETARRIRERKRSRHMPIIFVTGFDRGDRDVLDAYRSGSTASWIQSWMVRSGDVIWTGSLHEMSFLPRSA